MLLLYTGVDKTCDMDRRRWWLHFE